MRHGLAHRLTLVFALLLITCSAISAWLQILASDRYEQQLVQQLSLDLAGQIARNAPLGGAGALDAAAVRSLFDQLMGVNPAVEVYLLGPGGRIMGHAAPEGRLRHDTVDLGPIRRLLAGEPLPILGDDPRGAPLSKVFSVAPLGHADAHERGYVYVILQGEAQAALAADAAPSRVLSGALWSLLLVSVLALVAGVVAFRLITGRLRRLTDSVARLERDGFSALEALATADPIALPRETPAKPPADAPAGGTGVAAGSDDIALLERTIGGMARRIAEQWQERAREDQSRREMVATISHDLRTPLTSLHGYLETLVLKDATLAPAERRRYLEVALGQSRKVGRLAQDLFELAKLEHGAITPTLEDVDLADLLQDVFQKFELAAASRHVSLEAGIDAGLPPVRADLAMIERVLTNLIDNAIRHVPEGGRITVTLRHDDDAVEVTVGDTGPGIPPELRAGLFVRPFRWTTRGDEPSPSRGGLGLLTVQSILRLHGSAIRLVDDAPGGATFRFGLPLAPDVPRALRPTG